MAKTCYVEKTFRGSSLAIIDRANAIIGEYTRQGFDLTLRQLYYQFVARGYIPNRDSEYKRLGSVINDARLAGHIDWDAISDRTRYLRHLSHWETPQSILRSAATSYHLDHWQGQDCRPEVWIEKDALLGVIQGVCERLDVPYFSCRGYTSQSDMWGAAQRLIGYGDDDQLPVILHLGDHDPSGIDMSRDIEDRLEVFMAGAEVRRLALNMGQVQEYDPPPNPAKVTDSRFVGYVALHGGESWELDALEPQVMADLIENAVEALRDETLYQQVLGRESQERTEIEALAANWKDGTSRDA